MYKHLKDVEHSYPGDLTQSKHGETETETIMQATARNQFIVFVTKGLPTAAMAQ